MLLRLGLILMAMWCLTVASVWAHEEFWNWRYIVARDSNDLAAMTKARCAHWMATAYYGTC